MRRFLSFRRWFDRLVQPWAVQKRCVGTRDFRSKKHARPWLEHLEDRLAPATHLLVASAYNPPFIQEYTQGGALVQTLNVPTSPGDTSVAVRGIDQDLSGIIHVYHGTNSAHLATYNALAGTWSQQTNPLLNTPPQAPCGLAYSQGDIFAIDTTTPGNSIFKLNTADNTVARYFNGDPNDPLTYVTLAPDGLLFALDANDHVLTLKPTTMGFLSSRSLKSQHAAVAIAVDAANDIFTANLDGTVSHYNSTGQWLADFNTGDNSCLGIDISPEGILAVGTSNEQIFEMTRDFTDVHHFDTGSSSAAIVKFSAFSGPNQPPIANNDSYVTTVNTALYAPNPGILNNDINVDGRPWTPVLVAGPSHGMLTLNADGSYLYIPASGYGGPDSFTYTDNDGFFDSNIATVSIGVYAPTSVAMNTSESTTAYGTPVTFTATVSSMAGTPTGTVEFFDDSYGSIDLGAGTLQSSGADSATWTYTTLPKQLQATNGNVKAIRARYTASGFFLDGSARLPGGEMITPLPLTITGITADNKVYAGLTIATLNVSGASVLGLLPGDTASVTSATGVFASRDVGNQISVTVTSVNVTGSEIDDYTAVVPKLALTANIMPSPITLRGLVANKVYDGTTTATLNVAAATFGFVYYGDTVTLIAQAPTGTFASKNVGSNIPVTVSGITLGGAQASDYVIAQPATSASISLAPLTLTAVANTKAYDGTTSAAAQPTVTGLVADDTVTGLAEVYDNANPGSGKTLSVYQGPTPIATIGSGLDNPVAIVLDAGGNIYVANRGGDTVTKFAPGANAPCAILTGLHGPLAMAFDASGDLYVINGGDRLPVGLSFGNTVSVFAPGATTPSATLTGLTGPDALAIDGSGNVFIANSKGNSVSEFAPGATTPSATINGLNQPYALAFDGAGDLYVANYGNGTVSKFARGATIPNAVLTGVSRPQALAFDAAGNLFVLDYQDNTASEFLPGASTPSATLTGLNRPLALAFDGSGNLYVANSNGNSVSVYAPGATVPTATLTRPGTPLSPSALAIDTSGKLYVTGGDNTLNEFVAGAATPSIITSGFYSPHAPILDDNGNLYVANYNGTVSEFDSSGAPVRVLSTGAFGYQKLAVDARGDLFVGNKGVLEFAPGPTLPIEKLGGSVPSALAVDGAGDLFVASNKSVSEFSPGETTPNVTLTGLNNASAMAFDGSGNLFVANFGHGNPGTTISEFTPGATTPTAILTELNYPTALRFDHSGNLFVINSGNDTISEFAPGATTPSATLVGLNFPNALAVDSRNDLYVSDSGNGTICEFAPGATSPTAIFHGIRGAVDLAIDRLDNLYVLDQGSNLVKKYSAHIPGGYLINDGNGGKNYAVTLISNTSGVITAPLAVSITPKTISLTEPAPGTSAPYSFTIALKVIPTKPVTVYYQTRNGSAHAGEDYRGVNNYRVTFPAFAHGATPNSPPSMDIAVTVNGDASDGTDPETFSVVLTSAFNAMIDSGGKTAVGAILPAKPQAAGTRASIADFSAAGPSAGSNVFDVPVTLDGPAAQAITIYYSTADGTAKSGTDYVGQSNGHVTIAAGDTNADIPIAILADAAGHMNLTFTITISQWVSAVAVSSTATVTIVYPPAAPATVIQADSLISWSDPASAPSVEALDQVFAEMGSK